MGIGNIEVNDVAASQPSVPLSWLQKGQVNTPVILAIHGWASNAQVWHELAKYLPDCGVLTLELPGFSPGSSGEHLLDFDRFLFAASEAINQAKRHWPECASRDLYLLGWSLGGQVAAEISARIPSAVSGLITLASSPCFVARHDWPQAMKPDVYTDFCSNFSANAAKTVQRFHALQSSGAAKSRELKSLIKRYMPVCGDDSCWLTTLNWLNVDSRPSYAAFNKPQLHLLAENDALVPADIPLQQFGEVQVLGGVSHCMPLEAAELTARAVSVFVKTHCRSAIDKHRVARAFSDAAVNYDVFAIVQKTIAENVLRRVIALKASSGTLLDIGSGTGVLAGALSREGAAVIALDIAEGMLHFSKEKAGYPDTEGSARYVAADAEFLPFADSCMDGVVSSLAIQWCADLPLLFSEIYRVLKPGGRAVIATLGPATLHELKVAWQAVDEAVHINAFASSSQVQHAVRAAGFEISVFERKLEVLNYPSLMPLLQALKGIGAHNSHAQAPSGLMTRSKFQKLKNAYPLTDDGDCASITATYDTFYLELTKR